MGVENTKHGNLDFNLTCNNDLLVVHLGSKCEGYMY